MAEPAEQLNEFRSFNRHYYDVQRKLSLSPAIGRKALELEKVHGLEQRHKHELIDGIAEAIPGVVRNLREYQLKEGMLVAEDGQQIEHLLHNGLRVAIKEASLDSFFQPFWPQRARHELDEPRQWQEMADGLADYNTLMVFSPHSEEYASPENNNKLKRVGQEPKSKRGMLRVAHWDGNKLNVLVRSIDNSSVDLFKQTAKESLGYEYQAVDSTQMLGERIELHTSEEGALILADKVVRKADQIIAKNLGGRWIQGRNIDEFTDTQQYVESQTSIIENLIQISENLASSSPSYEIYKTAWEEELYNHISLIKQRLLQKNYKEVVDVSSAAAASGAIASANGESYNLCGFIVSTNSENQTASELGFESVKSLVGKRIACPECKQKVIVPDSKLREGRLSCSECKYEIDACTGLVYHESRRRSPKFEPQEVIKRETEWQRIVREDNEKKIIAKRRRIKEDLASKQLVRQAEIERQEQIRKAT